MNIFIMNLMPSPLYPLKGKVALKIIDSFSDAITPLRGLGVKQTYLNNQVIYFSR